MDLVKARKRNRSKNVLHVRPNRSSIAPLEDIANEMLLIDEENSGFNFSEKRLDATGDNSFVGLLDVLQLNDNEKEKAMELENPHYGNPSSFIIDANLSVKSVDLVQSILFLTLHNFNDSHFQRKFLLTIPVYSTPKQYLGCLFVHYFARHDEKIKLRVIVLLSFWMKLCPGHFLPEMISSLEHFQQMISSSDFIKNTSQYKLFVKSLEILKTYKPFELKKISSLLPPTGPNKFLEIYQKCGIKGTAEQLTLQQSRLFRNISQDDLVNIIFGLDNPPSLLKLTKNFDIFTTFVSFTVIYKTTAQERSNVYKMWLEIAIELRKLNNFYGLFSVVGGLSHRSVTRLTKTMELVDNKIKNLKEEHDSLMKLVSLTNNFKNYREVIDISPSPTIPFIACFQKDWVYFQETTKAVVKNLINVDVIDQGVKLLDKILYMRNDDYNIVPDEEVIDVLSRITASLDLFGLMKLSTAMEPSQQ